MSIKLVENWAALSQTGLISQKLPSNEVVDNRDLDIVYTLPKMEREFKTSFFVRKVLSRINCHRYVTLSALFTYSFRLICTR